MFFSSSAASLTWSFERRFINPNSLRYSVTNIYSVLIPICVKFDSYVDTYRSRWFCVLVLFASLRVFLMAMFLAPVEDSTDSTGPHWRTTTTTHIFFATYQKLQRNTIDGHVTWWLSQKHMYGLCSRGIPWCLLRVQSGNNWKNTVGFSRNRDRVAVVH